MGFRSTFTTQDYHIAWPAWFIEKYQDSVYIPEGGAGPLHSKHECKIYYTWPDLLEDMQQAIDWDGKYVNLESLVLIFLHECGGLTRYQIFRDRIAGSEPYAWQEAGRPTHHYCYGCSDLPATEEVEPGSDRKLFDMTGDELDEALYTFAVTEHGHESVKSFCNGLRLWGSTVDEALRVYDGCEEGV